jgi:excisionase family DNA binding protein
MKELHTVEAGQPSLPISEFGRRFINKRELAKYLACSTRQIEKLIAQGIIPTRKLGRRMVRFDLPRVEAALAKYDRAAIGETRP